MKTAFFAIVLLTACGGAPIDVDPAHHVRTPEEERIATCRALEGRSFITGTQFKVWADNDCGNLPPEASVLFVSETKQLNEDGGEL